jgi:3-oxoacyl-[acyl-carrier protein] reductase
LLKEAWEADAMTQLLLDRRVAVVTGSGQGIGLQIGRLLTDHGAGVAFAEVGGGRYM